MRSPPSRSTSATCRSSSRRRAWKRASCRTRRPSAARNSSTPSIIATRKPAAGVPVAFASERARYPFAHNRDLLRFSIKTAARAAQAGRPLNLVLLLDNSGSMERADRVAIIREALRVLAVAIAAAGHVQRRHLRAHGAAVGGRRARRPGRRNAGQRSRRHHARRRHEPGRSHEISPTKPRCGITSPTAVNRVVLLTDGAANLGNVDPEALKQKVEANRKQGIALDCFGIGWEGYNDDLLEVLSRNGDGRYGFINTPEEAATEFAAQAGRRAARRGGGREGAGGVQSAARDFVAADRLREASAHQGTVPRQHGGRRADRRARGGQRALHRGNESAGRTGRLRRCVCASGFPARRTCSEHEWDVPFDGNAPALEQSSPAMRLAATASAFSEWLASSPFAQEVTPDQLLNDLSGVPEIYGADPRPKQLER